MLNHELRLKPKEERRLRQGHLWVFSNEVAQFPEGAGPGDLIRVVTHAGESLGTALFHPGSLISARLLGEDVAGLDHDFFSNRISRAAALRDRMFPDETCFRLVYGESDFLPGLVIDRFDRWYVIQTLSTGMERAKEAICDALESLFAPAAILERNDTPLRRYEELPLQTGVLRGTWNGPVQVQENGITYHVDLLHGQKTGFFLDQKLNRQAAARYCRGQAVLDAFCNAGGFALNAARAGAASVTAVDSSATALEQARVNGEANGLTAIEWLEADVFDYLQTALDSRRRFDVIILDPPSFVRSRKHVAAARKAYRRLNELALRLLNEAGILVTASCSFHLFEETFYDVVQESAHRAGRRLQWLERRQQSPDHPTLPAMPETRYLKLGIFRAL